MHGIELEVVLAQNVLIPAQTLQKFPLGEATFPLPGDQVGRHTLGVGLDAVGARELALTLDLALLT